MPRKENTSYKIIDKGFYFVNYTKCRTNKTLLKKEAIMARKYSEKSQESVEEAMEKMKEGTLESGKSHKKVTNPKQAIAIGLSEARKKGEKVPPAPKSK